MLNGLNKQEIDYRISNGLINNEEIRNSRSIKSILLSNLITLFNFIHVVLLILVLTTGSFSNTTFIFSIIFNTFISIYQEIKAKIIIDKLKIGNMAKVSVIRNGELTKIMPNEILMDDILFLSAGDSLAVDVQIIKTSNLDVDESIITGESVSISKSNGDKLMSGTIIISGECYARVISINRDTYVNSLIKEASKNKDDSSYLLRCINSILKVVTFLIVPIGILLFMTQFFNSNQSYATSVLSSVAGIIGMIPEGLVLLTSISLTVGVIKMASKNVIIQKLSGVELLACVGVLCLDKTGTITDGSMKIIDVINLDKRVDINNILAGMKTDYGNATDNALNEYFKSDSTLNLISRIPFSSKRKFALSKFKEGTYALGALEFVYDGKISDFHILDDYVTSGFRIISLVKCVDDFNLHTNKLLGFVVLKDNIRDSAKETMKYFNKQNVKVKIISGDDPNTVYHLLQQIDMSDNISFISGVDLPDEYDELKLIVKNYDIFGRVTPFQKQLIVRALMEDDMVGYIGDGVNDILALKESDCGIALASGISAARSVSEVVLTDSDFSIIPMIVNEGRRVVNNIERVASMYLIKTIYSFLISLTCIILSYTYPFFPVQLSLISAVCVGLPSLFLAIEPNYTKVEKGFLVKVFRNALPSGICVWLNIFFLIMISYIFKLDFDNFRFTIVAVTGYLNLRLLYNISKPLTKLRTFLVAFCCFSFYFLLFSFSDFFLIPKISFWSILFMVIIVLADNYITNFLEEAYDKIVLFLRKKGVGK